jgi:hypothetical protein
MNPLDGVMARSISDPGGIVVDKAAKTAGELSELLTAEITRRVGPTTLRRGVSPAILRRHRDSPDQPNWTADPAVWGELFTVRFGSVWEEVLDRLQVRYDLRD